MKKSKGLLASVATWIPHQSSSHAATNGHTTATKPPPSTPAAPNLDGEGEIKPGPAGPADKQSTSMVGIKGVAGGLSHQFKDLLSRGTHAMAILSHVPGARQDAAQPDDDDDDDDADDADNSLAMQAASNQHAKKLKFSTVTIDQSDLPASRVSQLRIEELNMVARPWDGEVYSFHERRFVMKSTVWKLKFKHDPPPEDRDITSPTETPATRSAENAGTASDPKRATTFDSPAMRVNQRVGGKLWKETPRKIIPMTKERMTLALDGGGGLHMCPCDVPNSEGVLICNLGNIISCYKTDVAPPYEDAFTMVYFVPGTSEGGVCLCICACIYACSGVYVHSAL
jgi:hypothetical protein